MAEIEIDRLILQVPGLSAAEGQRLALQVVSGLGSIAGAGLDVADLRLDLRVSPGAGVDELAQQIVAEVTRQIRRMP